MASDVGVAPRGGRLGWFPFVVGGLSFMPLVGVLFGVAAVAWGLLTKRRGGKTLALMGLAGIGLTVSLYGGLFYFGLVQHGDVYDGLRAKLAQSSLDSPVPSVEFYKLSHGEHPEALEALRSSLPGDSFAALNVSDPRVIGGGGFSRFLYYKRVDPSHYYLRGQAPDGKPFSPGALVPQVSSSAAQLGLLDRPATRPGRRREL